MEIAVWGRGINDVSQYAQPAYEWVIQWFEGQNLFEKGLIVVGVVSALIVLFMSMIMVSKKQYAKTVMYITMLAGLMLWFFSAPLLRYGSAYLMLPIGIVCGFMGERGSGYDRLVKIICLLVMMPLIGKYTLGFKNLEKELLLKQQDYRCYPCEERVLDNVSIWIPIEGDQVGYESFPSTPYRNLLEVIELRGETIKDGFRVKELYQQKKMNAYGDEWDQ